MSTPSFAALFKKYRLRSEFETLSEFGNALADAGFIYEDSLYSHWQKGTRIPRDRSLILCLIRIFADRSALATVHEANTLMASCGLGYLTEEEIAQMPVRFHDAAPFRAPRRVDGFTGHETQLQRVADAVLQGKTVLLCGSPGVGKTAFAIEVAHGVRETFTDGVFWFRLDIASPFHIMNSIAEAYGEIVPSHVPIEAVADKFRSIVSKKRLLIVLDNARAGMDIEAILPHSSRSAVIVTSVEEHIGTFQPDLSIRIPPLDSTAYLKLAEHLLGTTFVDEHRTTLLEIGTTLGFLPLASQIVLKQIAHESLDLTSAMTVMASPDALETLRYENKSMYSALHSRYSALTPARQKVLLACSFLEGPDFSAETIAGILTKPIRPVARALEELASYSLLERSIERRYSLQPMIRLLLSEKPVPEGWLESVSRYYALWMEKLMITDRYFREMSREYHSIRFVLSQCVRNTMADSAAAIWKRFGTYYLHVAHWHEFRDISLELYRLAVDQGNTSLRIELCLRDLSRLYYYDGDIPAALQYTREAWELAQTIEDPQLEAIARNRLGKICLAIGERERGRSLLEASARDLSQHTSPEQRSHALRYLSEAYIITGDEAEAINALDRASEELKQSTIPSDKAIYGAVINTHRGVLSLRRGRYRDARDSFLAALASDGNIPRVRGTYTWTARLGLAACYRMMGYEAEAAHHWETACDELDRLGIRETYASISTYAGLLKSFLDRTPTSQKSLFRTSSAMS